MFAASRSNFPTQNSGLTRSEFGLAPWTKLATAGSRQTEVEDHCRRSSSQEKKRRITSSDTRQMIIASSACLPTSWNTRGGYSPEGAKSVASMLLPDILSYDPRAPVRYPRNGRTVTDDVADHFFSIYANRNVTDMVGPHGD